MPGHTSRPRHCVRCVYTPVNETRRFIIEKYVWITVFARLRSTVRLNVYCYRYGMRVVHCYGRGLVSLFYCRYPVLVRLRENNVAPRTIQPEIPGIRRPQIYRSVDTAATNWVVNYTPATGLPNFCLARPATGSGETRPIDRLDFGSENTPNAARRLVVTVGLISLHFSKCKTFIGPIVKETN